MADEEKEMDPMAALGELSQEERESLEHPGGSKRHSEDVSDLLFQFMKEQTGAMVELRRIIAANTSVVGGSREDGNLIDALQSLDETASQLQDTMGATNYFLSRVNFVFDRLVEVRAGDPKADPPTEGRNPTLTDVVEAVRDFDQEVEERDAEPEEDEGGDDGDEQKPSPFTVGPSATKYPDPPKAPDRA